MKTVLTSMGESMRKSPLRLVVLAPALLSAIALTGCVSVLPKTKPVSLYSFDVAAPKLTTVVPAEQKVSVTLGRVQFPQAAGGDRILTSENGEQSYIAEARWAAPAQTVFTEQFQSGLGHRVSRIELLPAGSVGKSAYRLEVDVDRFETDYPKRGRDPQILIGLKTRLIDLSTGKILITQSYRQEVTAKENRVSEIARAYSLAMTAVVDAVAADLNTTSLPK